MKHTPLPADATLETARPTLGKPEEHVRVILSNMAGCRKQHGNAHVRIGVTGKGRFPYHQIFYLNDEAENLYGCFDGKRPFVPSEDASGWSTESMSFEQVQALLGSIRKVG
jgi:hypothetical protein